jgi:hypothetical protein
LAIKTFDTIETANITNPTHIPIIAIAATQFTGFPFSIDAFACSRHSTITSLGIIFRAMAIPNGTNIRSSKYPIKGIGSKIRSYQVEEAVEIQLVQMGIYRIMDIIVKIF